MRFLCLLLSLGLSSAAIAELEISDAWIKNLPPSIPVRAGYLTLYNPTTMQQIVRHIDSPAFGRIEMHRTIEQEGMMRMEPVEELIIEPGARLRLEPGGLHLMMMQTVNPTRPGDVIAIRLRYADGSNQVVEMKVKK